MVEALKKYCSRLGKTLPKTAIFRYTVELLQLRVCYINNVKKPVEINRGSYESKIQ